MRIRWRGFELPTEVVAEKQTVTDRYGKFTIEPFERGFGTTVGNSLRRVLLSSLEGAAITTVRFENVLHEFASIPGVVEDVANIILNLKQLRIRMLQDQPAMVHIDVEREGPVTGGDIICPAGVEVVNKDMVICTVTAKSHLVAEMEVQKGRGYRTAEENDTEEPVVGRLAIDSIFSPILRVNYRIDDTRVGQKTNYDRLILEIWTDGTVTPAVSLVEAGKILRKHLTPFVEYTEVGRELAEGETLEDESEEDETGLTPEERTRLGTSITHLGLSARATNCLHSANIQTVGELVTYSADALLQVRNFGKTSLEEVEAKLTELGLALADEGAEEKK